MNRWIYFWLFILVLTVGSIASDNKAFAVVLVDSHMNSLSESGMGCLSYVANGATITASQYEATDPSNSLQIFFPAGLQGDGSSGGKCWFVPDGPLTEFYVQFHVKVSDNWQWHPVMQKLLYIYTPSRQTHITTYMIQPGSHLIGVLTNTRNLYPMNPNFHFQAGRWYKITQHYKLNSPRGAANGIIQVWVDDVLQVNATDVVILTTDMPAQDIGLDQFDLASPWGGIANVKKSHDDYLWYDHFIVSTTPIGVTSYIYPPGRIPKSPIILKID